MMLATTGNKCSVLEQAQMSWSWDTEQRERERGEREEGGKGKGDQMVGQSFTKREKEGGSGVTEHE